MTTLAFTTLPKDKPQIITERLLNAPRELVFKVLTEADHIKNFWGPDGFTNSIKQMDVKPGGQWLFTMHGPDGTDYPNRIIYRTVTPPSYLSWDHDGGEDDPNGHRFFGELELFAEGNKTRIQLRMTESSMAARDAVAKYAVDGGIQNLERLAAYVAPMAAPKNRFVIERTFAVSVERLFKACSDADDLKHWMGPAGAEIFILKRDFRPGGICHYGNILPDGTEMFGKQVFREITPPNRLVFTQSFADKDGDISSHPMAPTWPKQMVTVFEFLPEGPHKTKLKISWTYAGVDDVEASTFHAAHDSMSGGWKGSLDQLESYLAKN